jgi:hypothetical protein
MVRLSYMQVGNDESEYYCNDNANNVDDITAKLIIKTPTFVSYIY